MNALGADYSHWDGLLNFDAIQANTAFSFFKIGQGSVIDDQWGRSTVTAASRKLRYGGYWYYDNYIPPLAQAGKLVAAVSGKSIPLGIAFDFEDKHVAQYSSWRHLAVMMSAVADAFPGKRLLLYTSPSYWAEFGPSKLWNYASWKWFAAFPLWIAHYYVSSPTVPGPWSTWTFHQYTDHGNAAMFGSQKRECDLDNFNGTVEDLDRWIAGASAPPPATSYSGKVVAPSGVNVREQASTSAAKLGALPLGTVVAGDQLKTVSPTEKWLHITAPLVGWVATLYGGTTLVRLA